MVDDEPATTTREAAFQSANSKLELYANSGKRIKFTATEPVQVGELMSINLPLHNFNAEVLIESVSIYNDNSTIFYNVVGAEGAISGSWQKVFL